MRCRTTAFLAALSFVAAPLAALASTPVSATDLGVTAFAPSSARDVNAAGRIVVQGPPALDSRPSGVILLPPQPGGGELVLPCSVLLSCFHLVDVPEGLNGPGRVIGRRVAFGSGGPFFPLPATWSANGVVTVAHELFPLSGDSDSAAYGLTGSTLAVGALHARRRGR